MARFFISCQTQGNKREGKKMQSSATENGLECKQQNPIILAASSSYFGEQLWLLHK
ncbi:hypothetical protein I79_007142 [Cricetulus griseus]|uniref:Uncharacterized protein n=1 Tax=Cricetulus griseus TaxID=10029 RepID=G3H9R2_CRIGR|nr:hypothetical protein I79_007142 [Cricetulus griseus]